MEKILVINGPNLNMLGIREPEIYGSTTLEDINQLLLRHANDLNVHIEFYQSNVEGDIVTKIQQAMNNFNFILLNAGAFTHYSIAIRDAISSINVPVIEIHLSNIHKRESFRHQSVIAAVSLGQICGFGVHSYIAALDIAVRLLRGDKF